MPATASDHEHQPAAPKVPSPRSPAVDWLCRPLVATAALVVVYLALSLVNSTHGFLGTDTGGKVATLLATEGRSVGSIDLGYWAAAADPAAEVHGLIYTVPLNGQYVQVMPLPMIVAAKPLWALGGYRGALLLPMAGAIAAAFAARSLARRVRPGNDGWLAFWVVALATPITVYALDFWEHTIGVALMAWGIVAAWDAIDRRRWVFGLASGLLFGAAFSMRTESIVYGGIAVVVVGVELARRRRWAAALAAAGAFAGGALVMFLAVQAFERAILGTTLRGARALNTAQAAGTDLSLRLNEAWATFAEPFQGYSLDVFVLTCCFLAAVIGAAWAGARPAHRQLSLALVAVTTLLYLMRFVGGLGFVPGMVATTPLAGAALALGWGTAPARRALAFALAPLPFVFVSQFPGGAQPQWAGRYILTSGLVLATVGVCVLPRLHRPVRIWFLAASVLVTAAGVGWLSQRSHVVEHTADVLESRPEPVLIASNGFLPREFGATYGRKNWLAPLSRADLAKAIDVARRMGVSEFGLVTGVDEAVPDVEGYEKVGTDRLVDVLPTADQVTTYRRR